MAKSKYRVVKSFIYKGPEGNWEQKKWVTIGPGEEVPKIDSNETEKLLAQNAICEVDMYGENVEKKKTLEMNGEEISRLFEGKEADAIISIIGASNFGTETIHRMYAFAEKLRLQPVVSFLEQRM